LLACTALVRSGERGPGTALRHHPSRVTCIRNPPGSPLSTCLRASTPAATDHSAGHRPRAPARATRDMFRPRGFAPPRRFAPRTTPDRVRSGSDFGSDKVAGVLQPATDWGSARFRRRVSRHTTLPSRAERTSTASSRRDRTPRRFPRQQPHRVTTAVAPVTFHRSHRPRHPARLRAPGAGNRESREDRMSSNPPKWTSTHSFFPHQGRRRPTTVADDRAPPPPEDSRLRGVAPLSSRGAVPLLPAARHPTFHGLCYPSRHVA
jgi:hypothetical protein